MALDRKALLRIVSKTIFELIIVFVGVLLAFIASDLRNKGIQQQRFAKTLNIMEQELSDFVTYSPVPIEAMNDSLQQYYDAERAGILLIPPYYREPRASSAPTAAWEAMVSSGSYEILDPDLFYEMTIYYNRVISFNAMFRRYSARCEEWLLTMLQDDIEVFYREGKLKGEYQLLIRMLEEISTELTLLRDDAEKLMQKLKAD